MRRIKCSTRHMQLAACALRRAAVGREDGGRDVDGDGLQLTSTSDSVDAKSADADGRLIRPLSMTMSDALSFSLPPICNHHAGGTRSTHQVIQYWRAHAHHSGEKRVNESRVRRNKLRNGPTLEQRWSRLLCYILVGGCMNPHRRLNSARSSFMYDS